MKQFIAFVILLWTVGWASTASYSAVANVPVVQGVASGTPVTVTAAAPVSLGSHTFVGGADTFSVNVSGVSEVAVTLSGTLLTGNFFLNADNTTPYAGPQAYSVQQVTGGWTSVNNTYFVSPDTWIVPISGFSTLKLFVDGGFTGALAVSVNTVPAPSWFNIANAVGIQSGAAHVGLGFNDGESNAANVPITPQYFAIGSQCFGFIYNGSTWDRLRDANSAANTTGTGLQGVGMLVWDGTNWQKYQGDAPNSFRNLAALATTTIKSGAGVLHTVTINALGTADTATIYDNTAGSGTKIATINTTLSQGTLIFDAHFSIGLTVVIAGGTAADLTFNYQ